MYYTYIIYSNKLNKKYIGYSENLKKRINEHNKGDCKFTAKGKPWKLIYYEAFESKKDALAEEKFLKSGKGRQRSNHLLKNYFETGEVPERSNGAPC